MLSILKSKMVIACCAVVTILAIPAISIGSWYLDWADDYVVGTVWVDQKGVNSSDVTIHNEFNGSTRSWSNLGVQTVAGKANAVTMAGSFRRDRTTGDCGYLYSSVARWRHNSSGVHYSLGNACAPTDQNWNYNDGVHYRAQDTCGWGNSAQHVSSRILELSHSNNTYLPTSGTFNWEYVAKLYTYIADWPNSNYASGYNCYNILWTN